MNPSIATRIKLLIAGMGVTLLAGVAIAVLAASSGSLRSSWVGLGALAGAFAAQAAVVVHLRRLRAQGLTHFEPVPGRWKGMAVGLFIAVGGVALGFFSLHR